MSLAVRWAPASRRLAWLVERPIAHRGLHDVSRGIMAPKGTPADVIAKLGSSCAAAAKEPAFAQAMKLQGTDVRYLDRAAYAKWLKDTDDLNRNLAKDLGLLKR